MIHFPPIRTARLDVQLRELTIRESVDIAATPLDKHEAATTALLRRIVETAGGSHRDPGRWTVQERMFAVAHYIACTSEAGGNFAIGEGAFLDYLDAERDSAPDTADAGHACGDQWVVKQLTGDEALALEGLCADRLDWIAGDLAARMSVAGADEGRPDATSRPGEYAAWLAERMGVVKAMPEGDFEELFAACRRGMLALHHLFHIELDDQGPVAMPLGKEGGAALAPARFQVDACIGSLARELGRRPYRTGGLS